MENNKRKLVSIREIKDLLPIKGADFIENAIVDGWGLVVKKGEFQVGDMCVFFEIDCFLPIEERYSFLGKTTEFRNAQGYRLKTIKLRKTLSQGLALPLSMFPEIKRPKLGLEVTELLKVRKWERIENVQNVQKSSKVRVFPSEIPKTDQERIQNLTWYFDKLQDMEFEETLKLDGSSMTCYKTTDKTPFLQRVIRLFKTGKYTIPHFGVCSRNVELYQDKPLFKLFTNSDKASEFSTTTFWELAIREDLESKLPFGYAIQGELLDTKIQSNHEKVDRPEYRIFDVYNILEKRYLTPAERKIFLETTKLDYLSVPIVEPSIKIFKKCTTVQDLLKRVEGISMNPQTVSEGRVYKSVDGKITFKAVSNKYLMKED